MSFFITFSGIEGTGKSTQAKLFADFIATTYPDCNVVRTQEPGGTPFGMRVREILKSESELDEITQYHLFEAQRRIHVEKVIKPTLSRANGFVVCDRYVLDTFAYQNSVFSDDSWYHYLVHTHPDPDMSVIMWTTDISKLNERLQGRGSLDHFDLQSIELKTKKQKLFMDAYLLVPNAVLINADGSEQEVHDRIVLAYYQRMLNFKI